MYDVANNLHKVLGNLPDGVKLVAISKFHPNEYLEVAYREGQRIFGESQVQELSRKVETLPKDIEWHFIGHLQTNKVKYIVPYISMVEAVDSLKLLKEINKQAAKYNRVINVLLELHIAEEETKYGFSPDACRELLEGGEWKELKNVHISGLMMMASNVDDRNQIKKEMMLAADLFDELKAKYFADDPEFKERSWGMSHDYDIAVECRSTMVRGYNHLWSTCLLTIRTIGVNHPHHWCWASALSQKGIRVMSYCHHEIDKTLLNYLYEDVLSYNTKQKYLIIYKLML